MDNTTLKIVNYLTKFGITNKLEQAHFLAQCHHESGGFTRLSEGSNYRFSTAKQIFKTYLTAINTKQLELKAKDSDFCPQPWLFNLVYGGRMGNQANGLNDNDGFDYRGGGLIQLTGRNNYQGFLLWLEQHNLANNLTLTTVNDYLRSLDGAVLSAIYFWLHNNLGKYARSDDVIAVSKLINVGNLKVADSAVHCLNERNQLTNQYKKLLAI